MQGEPRALGPGQEELLLACCRAQADPGAGALLPRWARQATEWDSLVSAADAHGVLSLFYRSLHRFARTEVPAGPFERLRIEFEAVARHNLRLTGELLAVLEQLEAEGLSAAAYKGPALAMLLYGDLALRQFSDIEILVRRSDLPEVKRLLLARGYRPNNPMTRGQEAAYFRSECEYNFSRPERSLLLEVHWQIVPRYLGFRLDPGLLWDRLEPLQIGGRRVWVQAPQRQALMLALHHGGKHHWRRLGWICDWARLIQVPDLDWSEALQDARRSGCQRILLVGMQLARELLSAALPPPVERGLARDPAAARLAADLSRQLFESSDPKPIRLFLDLRIRDRTRDRIDYAWKALLTPTEGDRQLLSLPPRWIALYYLVRPLRLSGRYALKLWRRWIGGGAVSVPGR